MILVTDNGSTKTEWKIIRDGNVEESHFSAGINPYFLPVDDNYDLLHKEHQEFSGQSFDRIYFYGTVCNSEAKNNVVREAFRVLARNLNNFYSG